MWLPVTAHVGSVAVSGRPRFLRPSARGVGSTSADGVTTLYAAWISRDVGRYINDLLNLTPSPPGGVLVRGSAYRDLEAVAQSVVIPQRLGSAATEARGESRRAAQRILACVA